MSRKKLIKLLEKCVRGISFDFIGVLMVLGRYTESGKWLQEMLQITKSSSHTVVILCFTDATFMHSKKNCFFFTSVTTNGC